MIGTSIFVMFYHPNKEEEYTPPPKIETKYNQSNPYSWSASHTQRNTPPSAPPVPITQTKTTFCLVADVQQYLDNLDKISYYNSEFDMTKHELIDSDCIIEKVWERKYFVEEVELISEPDNPNDPNAIRVEIEGQHVGYVPSYQSAQIIDIVTENRIASVRCDITGGKYKCVDVDYSASGREVYTYDEGEEDFQIELIIEEYVK